jgi:hypothetical protein
MGYLLGSIPPLPVFKGEDLNIAVQSTLDPGATYSLSYEGPGPKGKIALNASTGAFSYTPAPQDRTPFKAVIHAKKDSKSEQQTVVITPQLPSEFNVIQHRSAERAAPDPEGWQYIAFLEDALAEKEVFNNEIEYEDGKEPKIETKQVVASGVRLVLERSDKYPLFKRLDGDKKFNGRTNLKRLTLCADEVVVRSRLELPGTDVSIYARKLTFEKDGQIVTTPRSVTTQATGRMDAHKGQDAGNVRLYVHQLETPGQTVRIITTGGQGQAAKSGKPGAAGNDMGAWGGHAETPNQLGLGGTYGLDWPRDYQGYKPVYVEVGYYMYRTSRSGIKTKDWMQRDGDKIGEKRWPGDGQDPKEKPGAPGEGGSGGSIYSPFTSQLETRAERNKGASGKKADSIPATKAGEPQQACWAKAIFEHVDMLKNKVVGYEFIDKHTSKNGAAAPAPDPDPKKAPKPGELKALDRSGAGYWLHPAIARAIILYAHDSMLAGRPEDARARIALYDRALADALKPGGALSDAGASSIEWPALHADIVSLIQRIDSPYDYFGNPAGWVPMLSFEANLQLYKDQIGEAIKTMYVAYWIEKNQQKSEKAKTTLENAMSSLAKETEQAEKDSAEALKKLGQLEDRCNEITKTMTGLEASRKLRMTELQKDAQNQVRFEKILRSSGQILGAVMQLAPVAQPALGSFGKGLTVLSEFDPDKPGKIVPGMAGAFGDLAKDKLTEKFGPLLQAIKEAKTEQEEDEKKPDEEEKDSKKAEEKKEIKKEVAKKKLAEKVKKVLDDEKAAKKQISDAFAGFAVSEDEVKERLQKLLAECPEYQELVKEIEKLNQDKAGFLAELMATLQILDQAATVLLANQQARIELRSKLDSTLDRLNHDALQYVRGMGQRARQRLLKYQYYLLKSYHYLMFEDLPEIDFRGQKIVDEFARILAPDGALTDKQYGDLRAIFDQQLQDIIEKIIDGYQGKGFGRENSFNVQLTPGQLKVLNETKELTFDPMRMASLNLERDKIRLTAIATEAVALSGLPAKIVSLSLSYDHDGISRLRSGGRLYLFRSGFSSNTAIRQRMFWETTVDHTPGEKLTWKESTVDQAAKSLLEYLIGQVAKDDKEKKKTTETLLSYRPSPWTGITIRCQEAQFSYKIDKLALKFSYVANLMDDSVATVLVRMSRGVERMIYCDSYDLNNRGDGAGTFLRTFPRGAKITLEAPGEDFEGWQVGDQPKPKGPLQLKLDHTAYIIKANFKRPAESSQGAGA